MYAAAIILHPGRGIRWLQCNWTEGVHVLWVSKAIDALKAYFDRWYCEDILANVSPAPQQQRQHPRHEYWGYREWVESRASRRPPSRSGELDKYCSLSIQVVSDPIQWWISHKAEFPQLSQMALDILAIPVMADDPEQAFSEGKLIVTDQRCAMLDSTLEEIMCMR